MLSERELGFRRVWTEYRSRANKLKLEWTLTTEEFFQLITQPCHYCGTGPGRVMWPDGIDKRWADEDDLFVCGGIDRTDSSKGYEPSNCVPCCTLCNMGKRNLLPQDFANWIERVYTHYVSKRLDATPAE